MSRSLFGLYMLFYILYTDSYFYIFTNTTLSWLFILIVSLEIRQHDSFYLFFVSKVKFAF